MSSISTGNTTTNQITFTGDVTGNLYLQTGLLTPTTAVTIDTSQRVGIGTSSPSTALTVNGALSSIGASSLYGIYRRDTNAYVGGWYSAAGTITLDSAVGAALNIDSSGNLGLGVTPSAWSANRPAIELGGSVQGTIAFNGNNSNGGLITYNSYYNGSATIYKNTGYACNYIIGTSSGSHVWTVAPSGTAGNTVSSLTAMTLNNSGSLAFGVSGQGIQGVTDGSNASAGIVGEYVSSSVSAPSSGLTSGVVTNATSISLTAGDWDVTGLIYFNFGGSTTSTYSIGAISTTSATIPVAPYFSTELFATQNTGTACLLPVPTIRLNITTTTTVYLVGQSSFSGGGNGIGGFIAARRRR